MLKSHETITITVLMWMCICCKEEHKKWAIMKTSTGSLTGNGRLRFLLLLFPNMQRCFTRKQQQWWMGHKVDWLFTCSNVLYIYSSSLGIHYMIVKVTICGDTQDRFLRLSRVWNIFVWPKCFRQHVFHSRTFPHGYVKMCL